MTSDTISEAQFLLTELRYTLGQLHVQVLDLDEKARESVICGDRSIEDILDEMERKEDEALGRYSELVGTRADAAAPVENLLPVGETEEAVGHEGEFEQKRARTIALLEGAGEAWPPELVDAVRQQVQEDRKYTTEIAECRRAYFERDTRPDLNQPLTTDPTPQPQESH
jgi:hypothetical protein